MSHPSLEASQDLNNTKWSLIFSQVFEMFV
jgi:hypothetical protein